MRSRIAHGAIRWTSLSGWLARCQPRAFAPPPHGWHKRRIVRLLFHLPLSPFSRKVRLALGEKRIPLDISVGDVVLYSKYGGTEVKYDGEDYLILSARDILAIVEK